VPIEGLLVAGAMMSALVLYGLMGGADFGGGVWDLFASGPRKIEQRRLVESALGPIWEANHVWLILVVVMLFSAFSPAFAALSIALHVPLTLLLVGIVFRGSAFTFRTYDTRGDRQQKRWGLLFSLASVLSPVLLGMIVGAIVSGDLRFDGDVYQGGFFAPWLRPFPIVVGLYALALFAYLAAVYLANEAATEPLRDDFCRRAEIAAVLVAVLALAAFWLSEEGAPVIRSGLTARRWTWPLHAGTGLAACFAFYGLVKRRTRLARLGAIAQVTLILLGWGASQFPYLIVPDVTLASAAASPRTLRLLVIALAAGSVLLFPSLYWLFRIFKGRRGLDLVAAGPTSRRG
jgi:cytochrome bd ubiquinol oxidase subunit II